MSEKIRQSISNASIMSSETSTMSRRKFFSLAYTALGALVANSCGLGVTQKVENIPTELPKEATETATKTATVTVKPSETATPTITPTSTVEPTATIVRPAENDGSTWALKDSNGNEVVLNIEAKGFTPDAQLQVSTLKPKDLGKLPADASDFQKYLNKAREGFKPLAGFTDGTNDYNQYGNHRAGPQVPAFSWMVHTGYNIEMEGIGKLTGEKARAVMVVILNRTERVYRFDTETVQVIAGFQGWGRIWNGDEKNTLETEKRLVNHYLSRLTEGVAETGFIGQCDEGNKECDSVTVVTVERVQWGNNEDGTPRDQFRLIRAETVSVK